MFHIFLLSVVLFYVLFFSLAARYIRHYDNHSDEDGNLAWTNVAH